MGQNTSANYEKSFRKHKKALKTNGFQGFDGGDKRDRTADLLNAIGSGQKPSSDFDVFLV